MRTKQEIIERLKKIRAMSERGESGESDNAKSLIEDLMAKYGIDESELDEDKVELRFVYCGEEDLKSLILQIACVVNEKIEFYKPKRGRYSYLKELAGHKFDTTFECSNADFVEIMTMYSVLKNDYIEKRKTFFYSFLIKNNLLVKADGKKEVTEKERAEYLRASKMANSYEKTVINKQIEEGGLK